jgi:hypothetical protein
MHDRENLYVLPNTVRNDIWDIRQHHLARAIDATNATRCGEIGKQIYRRHDPYDYPLRGVWIVLLDMCTDLIKPPERSYRPSDALSAHD